jgi:hypothetical protein
VTSVDPTATKIAGSLYRRSLFLAGLLGTVLGTVSVVVASYSDNNWTHDWKGNVPWRDMGSALLSAALLLFVFEWFVRAVVSVRTQEELRSVLAIQLPEIRHAVVQALELDPTSVRGSLSDEALETLTLNTLKLRVGDELLAENAYGTLVQLLSKAHAVRHNMRVGVTLRPPTPPNDASADVYFVGQFTFEYRTVLPQARLSFACVYLADEFDAILADGAWDSLWRTAIVGKRPNRMFDVEWVRVDGRAVQANPAAIEGGNGFIASADWLEPLVGTEVHVEYRVSLLILRSKHLLTLQVPFPCSSFVAELEYQATDISSMSVLPFFTSRSGIPHIAFAPDGSTRPTSVRVSQPDWIFPVSGVAFVWSFDSIPENAPLRARERIPADLARGGDAAADKSPG